MAFLIYFIVTAIAEIATYMPVEGVSMSYYGKRFVSPSLGFAMGWLYVYSFAIQIPNEITAAGMVIEYWNPPVNVAVWITIMIVVTFLLNILPVKFYGESEFWFASIKIILIVGLLILSFILFWGGGPSHQRLGFHYWKNPGAANEWIYSGTKGIVISFFGTLISCVFPFTLGPETLIVMAGEMRDPRRNMPQAASYYFWRLIVFYILCVLAMGVICPSNAAGLTSGSENANASPFVIGIRTAGISALDSVVNAGVLTAAWSSGNAWLYFASRSLYSLAKTGAAPKVFTRCDKHGTPYAAVIAMGLFMLLAYLNIDNTGGVVFGWFVNLTNTSGFISWICCCIIYIRFRKAYLIQGRQNDITWHHWLQPAGSYICIVIFTALCLINGFDVFLPGRFSASSFLTAYIGIPAFLALFFGHKLWLGRRDPWGAAPVDLDLDSGLQDVLDSEEPAPVLDTWTKKIAYWLH